MMNLLTLGTIHCKVAVNTQLPTKGRKRKQKPAWQSDCEGSDLHHAEPHVEYSNCGVQGGGLVKASRKITPDRRD